MKYMELVETPPRAPQGRGGVGQSVSASTPQGGGRMEQYLRPLPRGGGRMDQDLRPLPRGGG